MFRRIFLCAAGCVLAALATGQPAGEAAKTRLSGTVSDRADGTAMEFVTVVLQRQQKQVSMTTTDAQGRFTLPDVAAGHYVLRVSFVGYAERQITVNVPENLPEMQLLPIALTVENKNLEAVTIAVEKSMIEHHIDKIVINVADYIGTEGGNVVDILRKIAGITVDNDGNVSLNGQPAAVYLDGRPSNLSRLDLLSLLYFIDAAEIDKIEIIQNPSAKYDAAGGSAIINIRTKKNTLNGWSGSVQAGGGYFPGEHGAPNGNGGLTLNYRNKWMNTSWNGGIRQNRNFSISEMRSVYDAMSQYSYLRNENTSAGRSARMTTNFYVREKDILGLIVAGTWNRSEGGTGDDSRTENYRNGLLYERSSDVVRSDNRTVNYTANANYQHIFSENTHDLMVNVDYMQYRTSPYSFHETVFLHTAPALLPAPTGRAWQNTSEQQVRVSSAKVDYVRPLWKKATLEAGGKLSQTVTDNDLLRENRNGDAWQRDEQLSNTFRYSERIGALYASVGADFGKKWKAKAGLRWENTGSRGDWQTRESGDTVTRQRYNDFFPTAYVGYTHSMEHSFSLSYATRIQRPDYGSLNPFRSYSNYYTYNEGNPNLLPQYIHSLHLNYTHEKCHVGLLMQRATQVVTQETRMDTTGGGDYPAKAITWSNFGTTDFVGATVSWSNLFPFLWWSFNLYVNGMYVASRAPDDYRNSGWFGSLYMENTFYIAKTWRAELTGNAQTPLPYGYYTVSGNYFVSAGVRKNLWDHRASVSLYVDDLFDSQRSHVVTHRNGQRIEMNNRWSSRQIRLSFSYRFRSVLKTRERTGQVDERNRL
jgi:hypothetical protein